MKIFQFNQCVYYGDNISHKRFAGIIFDCYRCKWHLLYRDII